jgi:hypothetical protein
MRIINMKYAFFFLMALLAALAVSTPLSEGLVRSNTGA